MSEHRVKVVWKRSSEGFDYNSYNREHVLEYDNGLRVNASAALDFKGKPECVDPEEMLAGALGSCHMLTFLAIASKKGYVVDSYTDEAVAYLEKNSEGKMCVTRIQIKPQTIFKDKTPDKEQLDLMHQSAHHHCFIANSILSKVEIIL